jgi:hypothetical protein
MNLYFYKVCRDLFLLAGVISLSNGAALAAGNCPNIPGNYTILQNQTYALCAGAQSVNFGEITYAKCTIMPGGTSVTATQTYPFPPSANFPSTNSISGTTSPGTISTVNQNGSGKGGYIVSTYSQPDPSNTALYTCDSGSYAQCDGGLCFTNTTGTSNNPLWGNVATNQIICSCPVTTASKPYQVFGPATCPTTQADYDAICGAAVSNVNNGAIIYIGAPSGSPAQLNYCLNANTTPPKTCSRPVPSRRGG